MNRAEKLLLVSSILLGACSVPGRAYLAAAEDADRWLVATAGRDANVSPDLYYGTAGILLFHLEGFHATGAARWRDAARADADALLAALEGPQEPGLYTGVAGIGFALLEAGRILGEDRYRAGAARCVQWLQDHARSAGAGVEWNDTTDVISGSAGNGLFLLHAARALDDRSARELAARAGERLVELGRPEAGGLEWAMDPSYRYLMPNFSHGTAGVSYFLATLYGETRRQEFLDAALAGARYLLAVADTRDDGFLVFHHEPEGEDLFYYGWCHGPAGTSGLFQRLYEVTEDARWTPWIERGARSVLRSGIPERRAPGFWNNWSQCCGDAGVAEWFLDLHRHTGRSDYLAFARLLTAGILERATRTEAGLSWLLAERRVAPEEQEHHRGYMLGAAGFGVLFLHLYEHERGVERAIRLPDSPW